MEIRIRADFMQREKRKAESKSVRIIFLLLPATNYFPIRQFPSPKYDPIPAYINLAKNYNHRICSLSI